MEARERWRRGRHGGSGEMGAQETWSCRIEEGGDRNTEQELTEGEGTGATVTALRFLQNGKLGSSLLTTRNNRKVIEIFTSSLKKCRSKAGLFTAQQSCLKPSLSPLCTAGDSQRFRPCSAACLSLTLPLQVSVLHPPVILGPFYHLSQGDEYIHHAQKFPRPLRSSCLLPLPCFLPL